ncbi:RNA-polymerase II-associated protein 3-like C-terminal domain [Trinorchestia longiramus]|nr:RNA-polymerase II-associated protein 3-like C-terminal domain [Trinorchestia longiramus]
MSDEAHFHLSGYVNKQNCRYWSAENPKIVHEIPLHSEKITVWCGMTSERIIGPYFFENQNGETATKPLQKVEVIEVNKESQIPPFIVHKSLSSSPSDVRLASPAGDTQASHHPNTTSEVPAVANTPLRNADLTPDSSSSCNVVPASNKPQSTSSQDSALKILNSIQASDSSANTIQSSTSTTPSSVTTTPLSATTSSLSATTTSLSATTTSLSATTTSSSATASPSSATTPLLSATTTSSSATASPSSATTPLLSATTTSSSATASPSSATTTPTSKTVAQSSAVTAQSSTSITQSSTSTAQPSTNSTQMPAQTTQGSPGGAPLPPAPRTSHQFMTAWSKVTAVSHDSAIQWLQGVKPALLHKFELETECVASVVHHLLLWRRALSDQQTVDSSLVDDYVIAFAQSRGFDLQILFLEDQQKKDLLELWELLESSHPSLPQKLVEIKQTVSTL